MKTRKHLVCAQCAAPLEIVEEIVEKMDDFGIELSETGPRKYMAFRCEVCGRQNLVSLGRTNS